MLKIYPLRIRFSSTTGNAAPGYAGSAWRGAFGHALKKLVCIFKHGHCEGCPLVASCAYTTVFESHLTVKNARGIPSPYTLYPVWNRSECNRGEIHLYVTIIGEAAIRYFSFILHALRVAGEQGVGHKTFNFEAVENFDNGAWQPLQSQPVALTAMPESPSKALTLRLITPARFKHQGHFATPDTLTLELWLTALRRRLISLAAYWGDEASMRQLCTIDEVGEWQSSELRWQEMDRYSSRQKTAMKMGGVVGECSISAHQAEQLWPMLWLGQWTHIGKMATMGMGRYEVMALAEEGKG